jgi:peptidase E
MRGVGAGKLTYAGVSAGAVLAGPDLFPVSLAATQRAAAGEPTTALGLVPFIVLPHYGDPDLAVLIQLNATDPGTLRELVTDGWLAMAPAGLAP